MTTETDRPFRHQQFEIGVKEVITFEGMAIDDFPRHRLIVLVGQLLRDLRKKQNLSLVGDKHV